jgi:hypothetical protein
MSSIPATRDGIIAYPIKWAHYTPAAAQKVTAWVAKKVAEMLGAEEPDFVEFIMGLLAAHAAPEKVRRPGQGARAASCGCGACLLSSPWLRCVL